MSNKEIEKIDKVIGKKIQELRLGMGMSRQQLAEKIRVSNQQLQKYEKGINRISASRLVAVAKALGKPVAYFLQDADEEEYSAMPTEHQRMCLEVSRNFMRIKKPLYQDAVNVLARILADG